MHQRLNRKTVIIICVLKGILCCKFFYVKTLLQLAWYTRPDNIQTFVRILNINIDKMTSLTNK